MVLCLFTFPICLLAHDEEDVHPAITENAVDTLGHPLITAHRQDIHQGSIEEDSGARWCDHAYDPFNQGGWDCPLGSIGCPDAITALQKIGGLWSSSIAAYQAGKLTGSDGAFHLLGRALHLVQDMTSPAHVHQDCHGPCELGVDIDDFECWARGKYQAIPGLEPLVPGDGNPETFIREMATWTYGKTTFQGVIVEDDPQPDSQLKQMFPGLYFHDGGWFGDDYWHIPCLGDYDTALGLDSWWPAPDDFFEDSGGPGGARRISGHFYIEDAEGVSCTPVPAVWDGQPNSKKLLDLYAAELFPESVRYCAGMLQRFVDLVAGDPARLEVAQGETKTVTIGEGRIVKAVLHKVSLKPVAAQAWQEKVRLRSIAYSAVAGSTLDDVTAAEAFLDLDGDGQADPGESLGAGTVDATAIRIAPAGGFEIDIGAAATLILAADIEVVKDGGGGGDDRGSGVGGTVRRSSWNRTLEGSGKYGATLFLSLLSTLLSSLALARLSLQKRRRFAVGAALAAACVALALGFGAGCGGDGGGDDGIPPVVPPPDGVIQVGILKPADVQAEEATAGSAAAIVLPAGGSLGTRYEIRL